MRQIILFIFILTSALAAAPAIRYFNFTGDENQMAYYAAIGFTYAGIPLYFDPKMFSHSTGKWVYNNGNYSSGDMTEIFRSFIALARKYHLRPIPVFEDLSHVDYLIRLDNTLPETQRSVSEFNAANPRPPVAAFPCMKGHDTGAYHAFNCVAAAGELAFNKGADEFFVERLRIIKSAWGEGSPEFIHIGHDEIGTGCVCFVKIGRSGERPESPSRLVAMEINARVSQIDSVFGPSVKVIVYGDCMVPSDNGELFGLCGDTADGKGGVLDLLDRTYNLKNRVLIMPWGYDVVDGTPRWNQVFFNKTRGVFFLSKLGYRFILAAGESDDGTGLPHPELVATNRQCIFEWVRASQRFPAGWAGFAHLTWAPFGSSVGSGESQLFVGWSAPLLSYWAWTPGGILPRDGLYGPKMWQNVNYLKSRQDMARSGPDSAWVAKRHYR